MFQHFDEAQFHGEYMTATVDLHNAVSGFSLSLAKDSGWYEPVLSKAE
jgi:hypothetical protein